MVYFTMGNVREIGIYKNKGDNILNVDKVTVIEGKGLVNDRKFKDNNHELSQITLIEIENINIYNKISKTQILPLDFRGNIATESINQNRMIGKEFFIGKIRVKSHDLCRPCKYLKKN